MITNFSNEKVKLNKKSIFLAGPTLRNSKFQNSWRKEAVDILEKLNFDGTVYIPEFSEKIAFDYMNQVEWERQALINADIIIFYIPRKLPELPGFTTNVEFGMYLAKKPESVLLCCPEGSQKNEYLKWLYQKEKPDSTIFIELKDILKYAVNKLN